MNNENIALSDLEDLIYKRFLSGKAVQWLLTNAPVLWSKGVTKVFIHKYLFSVEDVSLKISIHNILQKMSNIYRYIGSVIDSILSVTPRLTVIRGLSENLFLRHFLHFLWHLYYIIFCDTWSIIFFGDTSSKICIMQGLTAYGSDLAFIVTH